MNEITLGGCSPTPLAGYLKGLGLLRLLSARRPETRAAWRNESLLLRTPLAREEIEQFFLHNYSPTPVMAPWNGGSGFYFQERKSKEKDPTTGKKLKLGIRDQPTAATKTVDSILASKSARLMSYREALTLGRILIKQCGLVEAPDNGKPKDDLVRSLRGILPDNCLGWLDAALLVSGESTQFPPLLGTGGNDGNLDFTSNFMQRLIDVIGTTEEQLPAQSADWLRMSLFGEPTPGLIDSNIGQFSPGQAGGPNATTGFDADAAINPWDFVLMIEGAMLFAAAAVRRNAGDPYGVLSFPFTVRTVGAGSGSLGEGDAANARGEIWMPLWNQAASYAEVRTLLSEGRVALGRKPARDALDFVRAVRQLGGYRGIRSFQRYGLLMRAGKAYLATPLERIEVVDKPHTNLLDELDQGWLENFRRFAQGETAANRFQALRHRLENAFFDFSGKKLSPEETQALLALLGEIQSALAGSNKARKDADPLPKLSEQWVQVANDHSPAFRIARALAGLRGSDNVALPLRAQLFPIHPRFSRWKADTDDDKSVRDNPYKGIRLCTGMTGHLSITLRNLLDRRLLLAEKLEMKNKPLDSPAGATLYDIAAFLQSDGMDRRIAALLPGLSLCSIPKDDDQTAGDGPVPAAFALLKLCFTPDSILRSLGVLEEDQHLPVPPGIIAQLASGHKPERAVLTAWRRLHASGLNPVFSRLALPRLDGISAQRAAAALLIPLRFGAYSRLVRNALKKASDSAGNPAA
jgi:CRISPR-associated protein Csx17